MKMDTISGVTTFLCDACHEVIFEANSRKDLISLSKKHAEKNFSIYKGISQGAVDALDDWRDDNNIYELCEICLNKLKNVIKLDMNKQKVQNCYKMITD